MSLIHRVTMFKLVGADKQKQLLAAYEKLAKDNKKVPDTHTQTPIPPTTPPGPNKKATGR